MKYFINILLFISFNVYADVLEVQQFRKYVVQDELFNELKKKEHKISIDTFLYYVMVYDDYDPNRKDKYQTDFIICSNEKFKIDPDTVFNSTNSAMIDNCIVFWDKVYGSYNDVKIRIVVDQNMNSLNSTVNYELVSE